MFWCLGLLCAVRIALIGSINRAPEINAAHGLCLHYLNWRDLPTIYNGLICGSKDIDVATESLFLATGLYHLVVVSGSHLVFIEKSLDKWIPKQNVAKAIILSGFSYVCLLGAPIFRAFVSYIVSTIARRSFQNLRNDQKVLMAGLLTLIVFPEWILSMSLQLSWMAALCMSLDVSPSKKAILCLVYISPILGFQNPAWSLNNILFLSVFDVFLFPFTVLTTLIPGTSTLAHFVWDCAFSLMDFLFQSSPNLKPIHPVTQNWIAVFGAQLIHYWIRR